MVQSSISEYHRDENIEGSLEFLSLIRFLSKSKGGVDFDGEIRCKGNVATPGLIWTRSLMGNNVIVVDHHWDIDSLGQKRIFPVRRSTKNLILKMELIQIS